MPTNRSTNRAAEIERELAVEILRGQHSAGSVLPSVRALAAQFGVTPPTIQRVVDRLESAGLVTVRRGSGVRVNGPERLTDLNLLPLWFEALDGQPERAAQVLADFLEIRRVLAISLIGTRRQRMMTAAPAIATVIARLPETQGAKNLAELDAEISAALVEAAGQFAVTSIFRATERLTRAVPLVAEALFGDRAIYTTLIANIGLALGKRGSDSAIATRIGAALAVWDQAATKRFRELIEKASTR